VGRLQLSSGIYEHVRMHLRPSSRRPADPTVLKSASACASHTRLVEIPLVSYGIPELTSLPAERGPLRADGPMDLVRARPRRPVDGGLRGTGQVYGSKVVESAPAVRGG